MAAIPASDRRIAYTGRVAHGAEGASFYWPASRAELRFTGTSLSAMVTPNTVYGCNALGVWVDGRLSAVPVKAEHQGRLTRYLLADNLEPGCAHQAILYKKQDCGYSFLLHGFETDGSFLEAPALPARKLEFYGDSVTSGYAVACVDYVGRTDPPSSESVYDDSWWSYASIIGRKLNARVHCVSQGGIAVFDKTGYFHYPDVIGMESSYDRLCYFPEAGPLTAWDFSR